MNHPFKTLACSFFALSFLAAQGKAMPKTSSNPKVQITTSMGAFTVELRPDAAPKTVDNFLGYVRKGYYKGTIFHRVIPGFMVQAGAHNKDLSKKPAGSPIGNEADLAKAKGLTNKMGTLAMALPVGNPFGGTTQFFVNLKNNPNLDFKEKTMTGYGYCPFGKVTQGMDVIQKIAKVKTQTVKDMKDVPVTTITIEDIKEVK